jgi:L-arabonate dehydrase
VGQRRRTRAIHDDEVIRPLDNPLVPDGGIRVLRGNLAPRGAVLKPSAATRAPAQASWPGGGVREPGALQGTHRRPGTAGHKDSILVLKNCGPRGYPGMAEVGNMGLPPKLLAQGITDMVRLSDARMSGTAYGTVVLHVAPEARAGGPLAVVREGDWIELDCPGSSSLQGRAGMRGSTGSIIIRTSRTCWRRSRCCKPCRCARRRKSDSPRRALLLKPAST